MGQDMDILIEYMCLHHLQGRIIITNQIEIIVITTEEGGLVGTMIIMENIITTIIMVTEVEEDIEVPAADTDNKLVPSKSIGGIFLEFNKLSIWNCVLGSYTGKFRTIVLTYARTGMGLSHRALAEMLAVGFSWKS